MRRLIPFLLLITVLTACGSGSGESAPPLRHNAKILVWDMLGISDIPTLDPALASDPASISACSLIYGGLVRLDAQLRVQPDAARGWTISGDGRVYSFHLRSNLRFADGTRVAAQDFVTAVDRALGPETAAGPASFYLSSIAKNANTGAPEVSAPDSRTVRIVLARPSAHFLSELAFPAGDVPQPSLVANPTPSWTDHAAGFGPYSVVSWQHTRTLTLIRNRYYWGGLPSLKRIVIHFSDKDASVSAYGEGKVDVVSGFAPGRVPAAAVAGIVRAPALALDYLAFNTQRLPFKRLDSRRAFAALWHPNMVGAAMGRSAFPIESLPATDRQAYPWLPSQLGLRTTAWKASHIPSWYLAKARYPKARAFPAISLITPRDPGILRLALKLVRLYAQLGVTLSVRQLDPSAYGTVLQSRSFDLALVRWGADYPDPQDFLATQLGPSLDNVTGWSTAKFQREVSAADAYNSKDPRRLALLDRAAGLAARKVPLLPLDIPAQSALIRPDLRGVFLTPLGTIEGTWLSARFAGQ